ncbi:MAG: hypothetical protein ACREOU_09010 [Candidatus Eiseniibacteriota bacterium]
MSRVDSPMVFRLPALVLTAIALGFAARPAAAQFLAPALDRAGFDVRARQPSLRLAMLGGTSLAFQDENNEINLWDFGVATTGLLSDRDSTSLDVWFDGRSRKDHHTVSSTRFETDRKGALNTGLLAVGRNPGKFAAGLDGSYLTFNSAVPAQTGVYEDASIGLPVAVPTVGGTAFGRRALWGARFLFGQESLTRELRTMSVDGDDVELTDGQVVDEPNFFDRNEFDTNLLGIGFGLGWDQANLGQIAIQYDHVDQHVKGKNETARRVFETDEKRPITEYSLTAIAAPASLSWLRAGLSVGRLMFHTTEDYRFSLSGGTGGIPLQGRGNRLDHDQRLDYLRTRVDLTPGGSAKNLLVGADFNVRYDHDHVEPTTAPNDFNPFIDAIAADTLELPQKVASEVQELRHWDAGVGLGYRFTDRMSAGAEVHRYNNARDGLSIHARQRITDLRGGVEYLLNPTWTARVGGWHRSDDKDVYTANNELVANALTLGAGYAPPTSSYALDAGFEFTQRSTNFPDPTEEEGSGIRFMAYGRWRF